LDLLFFICEKKRKFLGKIRNKMLLEGFKWTLLSRVFLAVSAVVTLRWPVDEEDTVGSLMSL